MKLSRVISVDPGRLTLGALHPEAPVRLIRTKVLSPVYKERKGKGSLNLTFACMMPGVNLYGTYILLLRLLFAALLIVSGVFILDSRIIAPENIMSSRIFAIGEIAAGGMLAVGLLSRFAMLSAAVVFAIISVKSGIYGDLDIQSIACFIGSAIFLIAGTGKYSLDYLIRKGIMSHTAKKRKAAREARMSYKAYRVADNC